MSKVLQQDWISKWATYSPEKVAIKEYGSNRSLTYKELNKAGNTLKHVFNADFNVSKGDRILILAENCIEYLMLFAMAQKSGAILVPVNYRLSKSEISYLIEDIEPSLIIYENKFKELVSTDKSSSPITLMNLNKIEELYKSANQNNIESGITQVDEDHPIFILYTSGSTGFPKGVIYSHKMLFWNSVNTAMSLIVNTESRTINCMPPFHTGGWNVLMLPFLHHGGYSSIMKSFDASQVLHAIEEEKPTIFMGVPTMLKMMTETDKFDKTNYDSLYYFIVGGESMSIDAIDLWHNQGVHIRQGYGMTEVGPNLTSLHHDYAIEKKGSIGRPNFYVNTKIVDKSGSVVPSGEPGELLLSGPMVTPGYWKNEEATNKAIENGWFHTGDLVKKDEDGFLYVVDRIKNMFISGGENIYPAEIERVISSMKDVSEVAVVSEKDKKWGEVGKAFIVSNRKLKLSEVKKYCEQHLAKFKIPKYFRFIDELPKNEAGKIDRKKLADYE